MTFIADMKSARDAIWKTIVDQEGGKLTLGTVFAITGLSLGGVGIAAAGGAIGLPLVLLLAPAGIWVCNEFDNAGVTSNVRRKGEAVLSLTFPPQEFSSAESRSSNGAIESDGVRRPQTKGNRLAGAHCPISIFQIRACW